MLFVNMLQVSGPKYYSINIKCNVSQLLFFEKASILITITNVKLNPSIKVLDH